MNSNNVCVSRFLFPRDAFSRSLQFPPQPELHGRGMPAYVNMHVDSTADYSTQLLHSKSSTLSQARPTSTTPSTTSVTPSS
ncbi:hypothetical protein M404DRAFT_1008074 [Pisolithus tinctorius Marx 270]|uniref:Uncharacterized protein n=1 Tax=Pisolithus tinctorius Marx 270 TaxID=870435 RepID=A0A0C3ICE1_PISTI|nr:hypothetical protein M404DRAFT_1008074 [Pisolithus tinctorius Marx 270]